MAALGGGAGAGAGGLGAQGRQANVPPRPALPTALPSERASCPQARLPPEVNRVLYVRCAARHHSPNPRRPRGM